MTTCFDNLICYGIYIQKCLYRLKNFKSADKQIQFFLNLLVIEIKTLLVEVIIENLSNNWFRERFEKSGLHKLNPELSEEYFLNHKNVHVK